MDQLASCYFCGGALDVSLSEYPVIPKEFRAEGDENKTVVLCGTCRKKLAKIVENVVAATAAEPDERAETTTEDTLFEEGIDGPESSDPVDTSGATATPTSDGVDDGPTMTRLEYNKVMRLLKNREFPVDRMEIRDVATNAYQISPDEFDAVIDAAIERDLLAEEDGQFVDPS